jgi:hypothetical protein
MRVYGVMAGFNGDTTVQYVELRMSSAGQTFTMSSQLHFFNAAGTETGTFTLTSNVGNGATGASILIGTSAFDTAWAAGSPDFIMPANVMAPSGKVAFGPSSMGGGCGDFGAYYDSATYGSGYTGTVDYPPAFTTDLPTTGANALQIKAGCFDAIQGCPHTPPTPPNGNSTDYEIFSNPTPRNNGNQMGGLNPANDPDGDGVCDSGPPGPCTGTDLCPNTAAGPVDSSGCSDAQVDQDGDGICSPGAPSGGPSGCTGTDNCPMTSNPGQQNNDGDALGNACDTEGPPGNTNGVGGADDCTDTVDNEGDGQIDNGDGGCNPSDSDGDGVLDVTDNCDSVVNPGQENYDGDSEGDACDTDDDDDGYSDEVEAGAPLCAEMVMPVNDDDADDALVNDGCPAVGASESICTGAADEDGDLRTNDGCPQSGALSEGTFNIGTGSLAPCGEGFDAGQSTQWPNDLVSGSTPDSTDNTNILDLTNFLAPDRRLDTSPPMGLYNERWDLLPGKQTFGTWINIADLTALLAGTSGFPAMFSGNRAFGGPMCTDP